MSRISLSLPDEVSDKIVRRNSRKLLIIHSLYYESFICAVNSDLHVNNKNDNNTCEPAE